MAALSSALQTTEGAKDEVPAEIELEFCARAIEGGTPFDDAG
jgi:hypothetical protein